MATLILSAAGGALGGALGGGIAGLGAAALGRAAGAVAGSLIDQSLLGAGSRVVETPRLDGLRVLGAREGAPMAKVFGRARVAGTVIWASRFRAVTRTRTVGAKGSRTRLSDVTYTVSLAVALCEGPIERVGRIWADGKPFETRDVAMRVHRGAENQAPDPVIVATEGAGAAPAYRGVAYVVFEDLDLGLFGDRTPQFSFEVFRQPAVARVGEGAFPPLASSLIEGVALSPGAGEFSLSTAIVRRRLDPGVSVSENVNAVEGRPDLLVALDQLQDEVPACRSLALVVSWFGDDLRCGRCRLAPAVEVADKRTEGGVWRVSGATRENARVVSRTPEGRPAFGGTPSDASVLQAIAELKRRGLAVTFYPFILMDIPEASGLPDPYGAAEQAAFPWRGRITLDIAPGRPGSADGGATAAEEVAALFGEAAIGDFEADDEGVRFVGAPEWSLRRFVLHYAHLCKLAGGVDAFCIGSELRGLTTIRSGRATYPAVEAMRALAADVRRVLGPDVRLTYAADWSEYFGHRPDDGSGDVIFHLDPLWADPAIDAVGVDNYMPLTDWRDGVRHLDAQEARSIYDLDYLRSRIEGGEGFDWFYASVEDREAQRRTPIADTAHGEDWLFRVKDIRSWWSRPHVDRIGGVRGETPTAWVPCSKPIWFTEIGCAAIDKGTNQPNLFLDPRSSESGLPAFSSGARDDHLQRRFLQAALGYWRDPTINPVSALYPGRMVETAATHVWTWDARPWPAFPDRVDVWGDGPNHARGHWANGRLGGADLAEVVAEICASAGLNAIDVSGLEGVVTGYAFATGITARQALQPLMLAHGFDAAESGGVVRFVMRDGPSATPLDKAMCAVLDPGDEAAAPFRRTRTAALDAPAVVRLSYVDADGEYEPAAVEARDVANPTARIESVETALALDASQARMLVERWHEEAAAARERIDFALPPSLMRIESGDVLSLDGAILRVDRATEGARREMTAVQTGGYAAPSVRPAAPARPAARPKMREPMLVQVLDAPALHALESAHQPMVAAFSDPWPGAAAVHVSPDGQSWRLEAILARPSTVGELAAALPAAFPDRWMRGVVEVRLHGGTLGRVSPAAVFGGANLAALRDPGTDRWELIQFVEAELVGPRRYRLSGVLRGQAGSPSAALPAGADFVLVDDAPIRIGFEESARGQTRRLRVGPAGARFDDPSVMEVATTLTGAGASPLAPAQLRARRTDAGWSVRWFRRSRLDCDSWIDGEPPFETETPRFLVETMREERVLRQREVVACDFLYSFADAAADGAAAPFSIGVREISARRGAGAQARVTIDE